MTTDPTREAHDHDRLGAPSHPAHGSELASRSTLPFTEFIALCALLMSMAAMSIDIMLPSLPDIGATFAVANRADLPLVVSAAMFGMAVGQLVWGPLADRRGRRPALLTGLAVFMLATVAAILAQTYPQLLAARFAQGIGAAVGRIIVTTVVRDLFAGRQMARVMSMVMMVFILVPVLAPMVGQLIILVGTWRWVLSVLLMASATGFVWAGLRLPETRPEVAHDQPAFSLLDALRLVLRSRVTLGYGFASSFTHGVLVSHIASSQAVFGEAYGMGHLFPLAFGGIAGAIALASFTNAKLVYRLGMRRLSHTALATFVLLSSTLALITATLGAPLWLALCGTAACFFLYGLIQSNFSTIAMQPVGRAAGMAASVTGSYMTAAGALFGTLVARQIDSTILPLFTGFAVLTFCALLTIFVVEGRRGMFRGE
jgi:MFS transporter, DHA1 family, multidrug resistance protein